MTRADDRSCAWLQSRGWRPVLPAPGLWWHTDFETVAGQTYTPAEAVQAQIRRDHEAATSARNRDIGDADVGIDDAVTLLDTSGGAILSATSEDERSRQTVERLTAPMLNPRSSLEVNT